MKTKEQIIRQIKLYKFTDEEWQKVYAFCRDNYGTGFNKPFRGKYECDYLKFMDWMDNGFGSGDLVRCGDDSAAIISYAIDDNVYYCAYFDMDNNLIIMEDKLYKARNFSRKLLPENEAHKFYDIINQAGYRISVINGVICKKSPLRIGEARFFSYQGKSLYGVVKGYDDNGAVFGFGYSDDTFINAEIQVPMEDVHDIVSSTAEDKMDEEIAAKYHVRWHQALKQLCYLSARAPKGGRYYYLTDKFTFAVTKENYSKVSDMRYEMGNYFNSWEDITAFFMKLKVLRSDMIDKGEIK